MLRRDIRFERDAPVLIGAVYVRRVRCRSRAALGFCRTASACCACDGRRFDTSAFAPGGPYVPKPERDVQWNRSACPVRSLGHCGACHTRRGPAYEERGYDSYAHRYLTGGTNDHRFAPDLSGDSGSGLGRVPADDTAAFLESGHGGGLVTFGSMVRVVEDSTRYLSDGDLDAIAACLKSLPPGEPAGLYYARSRATQQTVQALRTGDIEWPGAGIFQSYCARCHQAHGLGVAQKYPRLEGNPALLAPQTTSLVRLLVEGGASPHMENGPLSRKMPSSADRLTSQVMAQVMTFIRNTWGNAAPPITTRNLVKERSAIHKWSGHGTKAQAAIVLKLMGEAVLRKHCIATIRGAITALSWRRKSQITTRGAAV